MTVQADIRSFFAPKKPVADSSAKTKEGSGKASAKDETDKSKPITKEKEKSQKAEKQADDKIAKDKNSTSTASTKRKAVVVRRSCMMSARHSLTL